MKKFMLCACTAVALMFGFEAEGMEGHSLLQSREVCAFDITQPISGWPIYDPLSRTNGEFEYYRDKTWTPLNPLEKNQQNLFDTFLCTCVDFSRQPSRPESPISQWQEKQIKNAIKNMTISPVGCKLLHILIAKCSIEEYKKIFFIKSISCSDLLFSEEKTTRVFTNDEGIEVYRKLLKKECYITIPDMQDIESSTSQFQGIIYNQETARFEKIEKQMSLDARLFNIMLHWMHSLENHYDEKENQTMIEKRFEAVKPAHALFEENIRPLLEKGIARKAIEEAIPEKIRPIVKVRDGVFFSKFTPFTILFNNDEEYRTMYGISKLGFDTLSESMYLSSLQEKWIRAAYIESGKEIEIGDYVLSIDEMNKLIADSLEIFKDIELYKYYFSNPKMPKFGIGQYKCLDLDPVTGLKLMKQ